MWVKGGLCMRRLLAARCAWTTCSRAIGRGKMRRSADLEFGHPPERLRRFPPLSHRCALRAGGRRTRCGAALALRLSRWAAPVLTAMPWFCHQKGPESSSATIGATMTHAHRSATPISTHDTTRIDDTRIKAVRPLITPALLQELSLIHI